MQSNKRNTGNTVTKQHQAVHHHKDYQNAYAYVRKYFTIFSGKKSFFLLLNEYIQISIPQHVTACFPTQTILPPHLYLYSTTACNHNIIQQRTTIQTHIHTYTYIQFFGGDRGRHNSLGKKMFKRYDWH